MDSAPNYEHHSFWDSAPDELIARILAFLPCSNIYLAARGVCRKWRTVIWSPLFMLLFKEQSQCRRPWLLEFQKQMCNQALAFDLDGRQWFQLNFSFLPENAIILASSGGLLCLGRSNNEEYHLYICNPLTKKWRQLPSLPFHPNFVVLGVDHLNNTYRIAALVFAADFLGRRPFDFVSVFDSKRADWKKMIGVSRQFFRRQIQSVSTFDSKTGDWKETVGGLQELHSGQICAASSNGTSLSCLIEHPTKLEMFDDDDKHWRPSQLCFDTAVNKGKWGQFLLTPHSGSKWYDVDELCWSWSFPANTIMCDADANHGLRLYSFEGGKCRPSRKLFLPKNSLTRLKMGGRKYMDFGAVWYEPHPGAMI